MRVLTIASALTLAAAGAAAAQSEEFPLYNAVVEGEAGPPIPAINLVLELDGREVAADTTDALGFAEFPAGEMGEYGVSLQDPVPVRAFILVIASGQEWSAELGPGLGPRPLVEFPASDEDTVEVWLVSLEEDYVPAEPGEPADRAAPPIEETHAASDAAAEAAGGGAED